jgi:tetratricopeptide (TPR) repeat protein
MGRPHFVGRDAEVSAILEALGKAASGQGRVVLIEGVAGMGKSLLLTQLRSVATTTVGLEQAIFAEGRCYPGAGAQNAYQPFVEILADLSRAVGKKGRLHSGFVPLLKEVAPDWLRVIPFVGSVLGAGAKTLLTAEAVLVNDSARTRATSMVHQYAKAIEQLARDLKLLVLVIEDAQWIDHASADLLLRLSDDLDTTRLVVILSARPGPAIGDDPLGRLRMELTSHGRIQVVRLAGLTEAQLQALLEQRFGTRFDPSLASWLVQLCDGHPLFVTQYLDLLEQAELITHADGGFHLEGAIEQGADGWRATGRLASLPISGDLEALLDLRIQALREEERELLQIGSVQGQYFDSVVLSEVSETRELTVLSQLRRLSEQDSIIERYAGRDWLGDRSDAYAFEHTLMHEAFYRKLGPRERKLYHDAVSRALESLLPTFEVAPRKLLIDIAEHGRRGGRHAAAASFYLRAAEDSYEDGATLEAMQLCRDAISCMDSVPTGFEGRDTILGDAIHLHLVCGALGRVDRTMNDAMLQLAAVGEVVAKRAERPALLAEILALEGNLYVRGGRVPEAIAVMRSSVAMAHQAGDPLTEFVALTQLGSQLAKENLAESLTVRHSASELFERHVSLGQVPLAQREFLVRQHANLLVLIGLGEFDAGAIETGIAWMDRGLEAIRARRMIDEQAAALNYLAQAFASIGSYETAMHHLDDAIRLRQGSAEGPSDPWLGYNLGLMAHVLFEMGQAASAREVIRDAVRISEAAEHMDLLTLVWNYQGEVLLGDDASDGDVDVAERVLTKSLEVAREAGLHPSEARAASLLGLVKLRGGRPGEGLVYSQRAEAAVRARGDMPAVRTEEIHFNHHLVLTELGHQEEAARGLEAAWQAVERKLALLGDPDHRKAFLERVPPVRRIVAAHRAAAQGAGSGGRSKVTGDESPGSTVHT